MAKGQKRNNREEKKPKKQTAVVTESAGTFPLKKPQAVAPGTKKR